MYYRLAGMKGLYFALHVEMIASPLVTVTLWKPPILTHIFLFHHMSLSFFPIHNMHFALQRVFNAIEDAQSARHQQKLMKQSSLRLVRPQVQS